MSRKSLLACLTAAALMLAGVAVPAGATPAAPPSAVASFEGHTINLASGWGAARACLVWRQHRITECFRTNAELSAREAQLRRSLPATGPRCSSPLTLYSGKSYTGSHIAFWDEQYWQELSYYGFDNITKSFLGGACAFHLAQGDWGQGYWYPGYTGPWGYATDMGTWDNTISSIYID